MIKLHTTVHVKSMIAEHLNLLLIMIDSETCL